MFTKLKGRIWFKIKRYISKRRSKDLKSAFKTLYSNQSKIIEIANYIMSHPDTKFIYSALSHSMYMELRDVTCKIEKESIVITNGLYSYNISVNEVILFDFSKKYLNHLESRKRSADKKMVDKLTSSLGKVHEQLIQKDKL
jgi:hypothetical protein